MKVLLIFPQYPDSFWSFKHVMRFISKKASVPPLGLITISAMLPKSWQKKLVDMNVSTLQASDILWANYVFISAIHIQKESVTRIIEECMKLNAKIVAGGPLFTQEFENYPQIDHFILNEAEITLPLFLKDLDSGQLPKRIYKTNEFADIKNSLLPAMKKWMQIHKYPFTFNIQSSINLADDEELMSLMAETGFTSTFVGIETPEEKSLLDCNKSQNRNRDLLQSVKKIQSAGLQVSSGFIVGFDSDTPTVFQQQIDFIQQSGIVSAMVGLLNAPKNTKLYKRLEAENRLTAESSGNNTDSSMNFVPKMNLQELIEGYKSIIQNIYSAKPYYKRIRQFLLNYNKLHAGRKTRDFSFLPGFLKSVFIIGIVNKGRSEYWKLLIWTLFRRPGLLTDALTFAVYGYHFRTVFGLENKNSY